MCSTVRWAVLREASTRVLYRPVACSGNRLQRGSGDAIPIAGSESWRTLPLVTDALSLQVICLAGDLPWVLSVPVLTIFTRLPCAAGSTVPALFDMASPDQHSDWTDQTFSNPSALKPDVKMRSFYALGFWQKGLVGVTTAQPSSACLRSTATLV